jgi:hypothetical protein
VKKYIDMSTLQLAPCIFTFSTVFTVTLRCPYSLNSQLARSEITVNVLFKANLHFHPVLYGSDVHTVDITTSLPAP